ncbi:glycosyltransferase family 2 protein [Bacillus sp. EB01]|uniref:glycosyltransferase family 2 protein n=1 Tax=Bacillus sp. EB01 TaxID=1347086 RepID=UPI0005C519CD|nr:glycosyltransferase [Bacillus sp. EB01]
MDVSIIMPSFNRYSHLLLSLYALEKQTFDLTKMEVILIDDASTDHTPLLKDYQPPYKFKYIRNSDNLGLAAARNKGIKEAKGEIIIILDSEMVADPEYVKNNYRHHLNEENTVVIGGGVGVKMYSYLFPELNSAQIKELKVLAKKSKKVRARLKQVMKGEKLRPFTRKINAPIPLLGKKDITDFRSLAPYTVQKKLTKNILKGLGNRLETSPIAWMACLGNISLRRDFIIKTGGYDPKFTQWGEEDREFAYRLYKAGAKFKVDPKLKRYHQEHAVPRNKKKKQLKNFLYFQQKHRTLDVCIRSLKFIKKFDYVFAEKVLEEYILLMGKFPGRYTDFQDSIILMLLEITKLKAQKKAIKNLLAKTGIEAGSERKERIMQQRSEIESFKSYRHLIALFDLLVDR